MDRLGVLHEPAGRACAGGLELANADAGAVFFAAAVETAAGSDVVICAIDA